MEEFVASINSVARMQARAQGLSSSRSPDERGINKIIQYNELINKCHSSDPANSSCKFPDS